MEKFKRVFVVVMDSLGVGAMPDSADFGDIGVNTLGHISESVDTFTIPNLQKLGLANLIPLKQVAPVEKAMGYYGKLREKSLGKDTMTGHWEMMGLEVTKPFQTFTEHGFPPELIKELEERTGHKVIGNKSASGTAILDELHVPFIINQNRYSIFDRTVERNGLKKTAKKLGKGLITFSPLEQGLLTNRYLNGVPADSRIAHDGRFLKESALTPERLQQIRDLNDLAAERGQTLAEMALAWLLHDGYVTSVLVGASRPQQLLDNIGALKNTTFSDEELRRIDEISLR